jgi:hypothetical protein
VNWYLSFMKQQIMGQLSMDRSDSEWTEDSEQGNNLPVTSEGDNAGMSSSDVESENTRAGGRVHKHYENVHEGVRSWLRRTNGLNTHKSCQALSVAGIQIPPGTLTALQRNAAVPKDFTHVVPKPIVVVVYVNGQPVRALLDSGSLGDFVSTSLVDQLKLAKVELTKPLALQLAVQGSRSKVNWGIQAELKYQRIKGQCYFDVANLLNYDLILGTPWLFQH